MPEWLILTIKIATGPVVGAVIGFFTNWLAVKMLFRPYRELRWGKLRLPFTPGIIPKRKEALGRALGKAVGTQLITPADIQKLFVSPEITEKVGKTAADALCSLDETLTARDLLDRAGDGAASRFRDKTSAYLTEKLLSAVRRADLPALLSEHSADALFSSGGIGNLFGALGGRKLAASLARGVGKKLEVYLEEHGRELLQPVVEKELDNALNASLRSGAESLGLTRERAQRFAVNVYTSFVVGKIADFVADFDIAGIVERKVNEMEMAELERLFMTVMKRELSAIVNLGALLGGIVGIVNSLVMLFL